MATMKEREPVEKGDLFKVGDVVRLKAGGPGMTIEAMECQRSDIGPDKYFTKCVWYSGTGDTLRATFAESMLEDAAAQ
jgi:uncharacterized protein YodC (DUF2158 family)